MAASSSSILLNTSMQILRGLIASKARVLDVDRNPLLRWILKRSFYAQFCAGEDKTEVQHAVSKLKELGYDGMVLEYASEVLEDSAVNVEQDEKNIDTWRRNILETVKIANKGDFVAFKWSGMGGAALRLLKQNLPPSPTMSRAMKELCDAAVSKGVLLLPAAEPQNANAAVDAWTLDLARIYNKIIPGHALIYSTYQCYGRWASRVLAEHLADAKEHNYVLGVKLVRGAYLETEKRDLLWSTIDETHHAYDSITEAILRRTYNKMLLPTTNIALEAPEFPDVNLVLATHNNASVQAARRIRAGQLGRGEQLIPLYYAQLQGMADEISCGLINVGRKMSGSDGMINADVPQVYKYCAWGSLRQCLTYLLRRAAENKDAMSRTVDTKQAMRRELQRRLRNAFGFQ